MADGVRSSHGRKFGLAYFALAALVGASIGTFILLVERPAPPPPPPWSLWKPTAASPLERANEIAEFVGAQYHLPSGHRLVRVVPGDPASANDPIRALAIQKTSHPTSQNDFNFVDASSTVMYIMCGAGAKCAIKEGKPSLSRGTLLRREALELALYTLEYVPGTSSVVAFFPPRPGKSPTYALYFSKDELGSQLDRPLARTLPRHPRAVPGRLTSNERKKIDDLTLTRYFQFQLQRAGNGERVLVLAPASV